MAWQVAGWKIAIVLAQFAAFFGRTVARTSWQNVVDVIVLLSAAWAAIVCASVLLRALRTAAWGLALLIPVAAFVLHNAILTPRSLDELWQWLMEVGPLPMNAHSM